MWVAALGEGKRGEIDFNDYQTLRNVCASPPCLIIKAIRLLGSASNPLPLRQQRANYVIESRSFVLA